MKVKTDIRNLCDGLDEKYLEELEADLETEAGFDTERIKHLAFKKLCSNDRVETKESNRGMKRISYKVLMVAALLVVVTTSAFAVGGMDFFRSIFGDSAKQLEDNVQQVGVSSKNDDFEMTAEQLVSDGFNTKVIVSLKPLSQQAQKWMSKPETSVQLQAYSETKEITGLGSTGSSPMPQFDTKDKFYYCVDYTRDVDYTGQPITVQLYALSTDEEEGNILGDEDTLSLVIEKPEKISKGLTVDFEIPEDRNSVYPLSLTVNPISAVLMLQAPEGNTKTQGLDVVLVMKDGKTETIFEKGWVDADASGGGGIALAEDPSMLPLATGNSYSKDEETFRIAQIADFSRILDLDEVDYVLIDNKRFELK